MLVINFLAFEKRPYHLLDVPLVFLFQHQASALREIILQSHFGEG